MFQSLGDSCHGSPFVALWKGAFLGRFGILTVKSIPMYWLDLSHLSWWWIFLQHKSWSIFVSCSCWLKSQLVLGKCCSLDAWMFYPWCFETLFWVMFSSNVWAAAAVEVKDLKTRLLLLLKLKIWVVLLDCSVFWVYLLDFDDSVTLELVAVAC